MKRLLFLVLSITWGNLVFSQVQSVDGKFQIEFGLGCDPMTVHIEPLVDFEDITVNYIFEANFDSITTTDTFHTYTAPGEYLIYQIISEGEDKEDSLWLTVVEPTTPSFDYFYCNNTEISVAITDTVYDYYHVFTPFDTTVILKDNRDPVGISVPTGNSVDLSVKGYYDDAEPNCGESPTETIELRELINTVEVTDYVLDFVCEEEFALLFRYTADTNTYYTVEYTNSSNGDSTVYTGKLNQDSLYFPSLPYQAPMDSFCFRINAISTCDNSIVEGEWICEAVNDNLTAFTFGYASYNEDNHIELQFSENNNGTFSYLKSADNEPFENQSGILPGHIDSSTYKLREYSYELSFTPGCEASTQFLNVSPPYLVGQTSFPNNYQLSWTEGVYDLSGTSSNRLVISNSDESETEIYDSPFPNEINLTYHLGVDQKIWVETVIDTSTIRSNPLLLTYEYVIYVPSAFTPNGDGVNEVLQLFGLPSDQFTFKVFNRLGKILFETSTIGEYWDGTNHKGEVIPGPYAYKVDFYNEAGELFTQQGSFVILK